MTEPRVTRADLERLGRKWRAECIRLHGKGELAAVYDEGALAIRRFLAWEDSRLEAAEREIDQRIAEAEHELRRQRRDIDPVFGDVRFSQGYAEGLKMARAVLRNPQPLTPTPEVSNQVDDGRDKAIDKSGWPKPLGVPYPTPEE